MEKQQPDAGAEPAPAPGAAYRRPEIVTFDLRTRTEESITLPSRRAGDPVTGLLDRFAEEHPQSLQALQAVAASSDSLGFADLVWPPYDHDDEDARLVEGRDLGVMFESLRRVVVIEEHVGELRYYAGGWWRRRLHLGWETGQIEAEGGELGVFPSLPDAVRFTERYLAREEALQDIDTPRRVRSRRETDKDRLAAFGV